VFVTLTSEVAAAVACLWTARRARAGDRRWRWFIGGLAIAMAGTNLVTAATLLRGGSVASRTSTAYLALDGFYVLALAGLLCLPTCPVDSRVRRGGLRRWHAIIVLDCLMIVGSVVLLEWGTLLRPVVHPGLPRDGQLAFSLLHQMGALILAVAVVLIASFRRPRSPATLTLLGAGLLVYGLTASAFVYRDAHGDEDLPAWSMIFFTIALLLMMLAALVPAAGAAQADAPVPQRRLPCGRMPSGLRCGRQRRSVDLR
jgi:hypothetical protein